MERDERRLNARYLLLQIQAALVERQTLLSGADTPAAQDRVNALGHDLAQLMDQVVEIRPPAAPLDEQPASGEFDRFLNRGDAEAPRRLTARTLPARPTRRTASRRGRSAGPRVVACAWCASRGRKVVAVRLPHERRWYDGSHAFSRALKTAGFASHGVCAVCRPAVAAEWGCPIVEIQPPAALLVNKAAASGEFDRFLNRGDAEAPRRLTARTLPARPTRATPAR